MSAHELRLSPFDGGRRSPAARSDETHALEQPVGPAPTPRLLGLDAIGTTPAPASPHPRRSRPALYGTPRALVLGRFTYLQAALGALCAAVAVTAAALALTAATSGGAPVRAPAPPPSRLLSTGQPASTAPATPRKAVTKRTQRRRPAARGRRAAPARRAAPRKPAAAAQPAAPRATPAPAPAPAPAPPPAPATSFSQEFAP